MKSILRWCLLGLFIASGSVHAIVEVDVNGVLQQVDNGILIGAKGVRVGARFFDVQFVDGTCKALFSGCDELQDFPFSEADTYLAARALDFSVFIDASYPFDTAPNLTRGCANMFNCSIAIPYTFDLAYNFVDENGNPADGQSAVFHNNISQTHAGDGEGIEGLFVEADSSTQDKLVYALWTQTGMIPEPEAAACLVLGLLPLLLVHWRRTRPRGHTQ